MNKMNYPAEHAKNREGSREAKEYQLRVLRATARKRIHNQSAT